MKPDEQRSVRADNDSLYLGYHKNEEHHHHHQGSNGERHRSFRHGCEEAIVTSFKQK